MHFSSREEKSEIGTSWKRAEHQGCSEEEHSTGNSSTAAGMVEKLIELKKKRSGNRFKEAFSGNG